MIKQLVGGGQLRFNALALLGVVWLLFAGVAFGGVRSYNYRALDSSSDPSAPIPVFYVADTKVELDAIIGEEGDSGYAIDTLTFYSSNGLAWDAMEPNLPAGSTTQIQFNDGGAFAGDSAFVWDKTENALGIGATPSATNVLSVQKDQNLATIALVANFDSGVTGHSAFQLQSDTAGGNNAAFRSHADARTTVQCGAALGGFNDVVSVAGAGLNLCALGSQSVFVSPGNTRMFQYTSTGHVKTYGTAPSVSGCGTSPTVATGSNDHSGLVTLGSAGPTGCTITFANAYDSRPACNVNYDGVRLLTVTTTTTTLVVAATAGTIDGTVLMYNCTEPST